MDADAIVVGAGFAGLACARALRAAGRSVIVLEARERVGGRSAPATLAGRTVDVGGQWVGTGHTRLCALLDEHGLRRRPQYDDGANILRHGGRNRRFSGDIPRVHPWALLELELALRDLARRQADLPPDAPWHHPRARQLDAVTLETWARRRLRSGSARAMFDAAVRAVFSAEPGDISLLYFLFYCRSNDGFETLIGTAGGAQAEVVEGGMHALASALAEGVDIRLGEPVRTVRQMSDRVSVATGAGTHEASRLVLTVPPALQADITFEPDLPVARDRLGRRMPMGSVIKCLVAYERPFWREAGLSGMALSHEQPFSPVFDASPADGSQGALVGFFDGAPAVDWSPAEPAARRAAVLDSLAAYFGDAARAPVDYVENDWLAEPWSRGCYVGLMPPRVLTEVGTALRAPIGRLHFAGTETATEYCGYIEGAIRSGERAAAEVLDGSD
ncbi:amine oxidase [Salinisphaera sp. PC39]|uniref:flavin monoamine oxidase family protein n=1 Tax=Salinisphaera sp. PC39 TaxID=1304156 RepID=UPI0033415C0B